MGIAGWVHTGGRDIRDELLPIAAMAAAIGAPLFRTDTNQLGRRAGVALRGRSARYAELRRTGQPDPDLVVVIDGQLTNRDRLRQQLGHPTVPQAGDAELLLHAYRRWGPHLVHRIDGTYAIGIWDNRQQRLLLIRDRLGAKTWHYQSRPDESGVLFATHIRALLAHPDVPHTLAGDGLNELLLGAVRTPGQPLIRGLREIPPGHYLDTGPGQHQLHAYWRWHAAPHEQDVDTTVAAVRSLLADNTLDLRRQPPGAILLSGVASAAAAAFTSPPGDRPAAYTLTLAGPWTRPDGDKELAAAADAAGHLHLRHRLVLAEPFSLLETAEAARHALDLPGESGTDAPLLALLRRAAADASSAVTGDGADAVFGGYRGDPGACQTLPWLRCTLNPTDLLTGEAHLQLRPADYRRDRYRDALDRQPRIDGEDPVARAHRQLTHLALTHRLPATLRRLDQLAEAAGLAAVHSPFADPLLAQYLLTVPHPVRHLLGQHLGLLRHAIADLLPAAVTWLPSRPLPPGHLLPGWRRVTQDRLRDLLADPGQPLQPLLDPQRIAYLMDLPEQFLPRGWHRSIASLLETNAWLSRHQITVP